jgi:hypothetical protein
MRRREFLALLGGVAAALPLAASAQEAVGVRRIGVLLPNLEDDPQGAARAVALEQGLGARGWTVGRNVRIDYRWGINEVEKTQAAISELLRLLAAWPHAFAQEFRIERRERNDHDDGEDCEIRPKARDGDRAGCCEQCGGRGDHEQACLEVSRDWHPLLYHFRGSEVVPHMTLDPRRTRSA